MKKDSKSSILILIIVAIIALISVTYAFITITKTGTKENTITGGSFTVTLDDKSESLGNGVGDITLEDQFPVDDATGKTKTPYTFTLNNTSNKDASYTIYIDEETVEGTRMDDSHVKVYLADGSGDVLVDATKVSDLGDKITRTVGGISVQSRVLYSNVLTAGRLNTFVLRFWISNDANADVMGKQFATKVSVDAVQVPEYAVTVINDIDPIETVSKAVFRTANATLTITKGTGTASVICTNGTATITTNATNSSKLDVNISNVTAHTQCTVSYN